MSETFDITSGVAKGQMGRRMSGSQIVDACSAGIPIYTIINPGPSCNLKFANWGDVGYRIIPNENCVLNITAGNLNELQKITIIIEQPISGGCEITLPDDITWTGNIPPFIDSQIRARSILEVIWDGAATLYGRMIYG